MTLFSRYMFKQALVALLMILCSLTGIVWIAMALKQLSLMTDDGQTGAVFLEMTALILPDILTIIAPVALLIAALHTLNRLNTDSELIVMTAAGATVWTFARPLLMLAGLVAAWVMLANFLVTPWSLRALNDVANRVRTDLVSQILQPGRFASPENNLTFHIRDRDGHGRMLGLILDDTREKGIQMTYLAEVGEVIKRSDKSYLILHTGNIVRRETGHEASVIQFETYTLDLATISEASRAEGPKPHARYLSELLSPDPGDFYYKTNPGTFRAELHERFASILYPFVFVLVVVSYLGLARTNRQSRVQSQVSAFLAAAGLKFGGIAATNLASSEAWAVALVYGLPVGGMVMAALAAQRGMAPRRRSWLVRLTSGLAARFGMPAWLERLTPRTSILRRLARRPAA